MSDVPQLSEGPFAGWDRYPNNLPTITEDQFLYDLGDYNERLSADSKRLFIPHNRDTCIQVTQIGSTPCILNGLRELEQCLLAPQDLSGTRILQIPQQSSIGQLAISETALRKLLTVLGVFAPFLDVLHAFGRKLEDDEDTSGSYQDRVDPNNGTYESCMLIKHAERYGREEQTEPWSIRQMGVYFRRDKQTRQNTLIILNPSRRFQRRLLNSNKSANPSAQDLHLLLLTSATRQWRQYLDYLEDRLDHTNKKIKQMANTDVRFADMLEIQNIRHKICLALNALSTDTDAMQCIVEKSSEFLDSESLTAVDKLRPMSSQCRRELRSQSQRAENIMRRLDGATALIRNILDFQSDAALRLTSEKASDTAQLAASQNTSMLKLTADSRTDSRTLKTITILTLLYLPASFVSTMLGMDYIDFKSTHPVKVLFKPGLYIFAGLTILLLVLTLGFWRYSEWRYRDRSKHLSWTSVDEKVETQV